RRAGVPESFYRTWKIATEQDRTIIEVANGRCIRITFPHASADVFHDLARGVIRTSRAGWMYPPPERVRELVPDFVIPFSRKNEGGMQPLFVVRSADEVDCTVDLPLSILLTLSRWEETLTQERDVHGRFAADQSVSVRENFLHRPIVDEYGLAFLQALTFLYPS